MKVTLIVIYLYLVTSAASAVIKWSTVTKSISDIVNGVQSNSLYNLKPVYADF